MQERGARGAAAWAWCQGTYLLSAVGLERLSTKAMRGHGHGPQCSPSFPSALRQNESNLRQLELSISHHTRGSGGFEGLEVGLGRALDPP